MQFLITGELDKREEQDVWLESSKVAQRKKNSFFSSAELMVLIGTIWNTWEKPLSLTEPIFLWGSTGPLRISNAIFGCPFFHLQFSTMLNFSLLQIFLFLQNQHGIRVLEVFPAARGAPGCSRGWESDFCQLQTLQLRICKIRESGSAATPLFMLVPFK